MNSVSAHVRISGKVQGVFFRATAKQVAEKNDLTGWVKNVRNGNVEAMVSGDIDKVEKFIAWCKHGPVSAQVESVDVGYIEKKIFKEFSVERE